MKADRKQEIGERIAELCVQFKLPTVGAELCRRLLDAGHEKALAVVADVFELEEHDRHERRVDRLRRASKLPPGKTFDTLEETRLPKTVLRQARQLATGEFVENGTNVLCFGLPGRGKSHVACAIGHALVDAGHSVLFAPAYQIVQELLVETIIKRRGGSIAPSAIAVG